MSGGSFEYVYGVDFSEGNFAKAEQHLPHIADILDENGYPVLAARTRDVLGRIKLICDLLDELDETANGVRDAWHTIEWWYSGDIGHEQAYQRLDALMVKIGADAPGSGDVSSFG
jgi:hypothetical protein